jgi:DNA-binding MarR family transcriptional regulator
LTTIELSEKIGVRQSAVSRLSRKGEKMAYETNFDFI